MPAGRPASGDLLILDDGRPFILIETEDVLGWWFRAKAADGASTLQGNLRLEWDGKTQAWCPARIQRLARPPSMTEPPSMLQRGRRVTKKQPG